MDAIKAPDALVQKTLNLMLEEHKKLEVITDTNADLADFADLNEVKALSKKNRWVARAVLPAAVCLCLCLSLIVPRLLNHEALEALEADEQHASAGLTESVIKALATDNLATRSGPATEYRETGTYQVKGEHVRLISLAYDEGGLCWVQCEVLYGKQLRRVYTGLKRFDVVTFDLDSVPEEDPPGDQARVIATSKAMYGPGDGYGAYAELTVDKGQTVTVIAIENDYAQVEWTTSRQSYRAWVPVHTLRY